MPAADLLGHAAGRPCQRVDAAGASIAKSGLSDIAAPKAGKAFPPDPVNLNGRRHEKILDSAIDAIGNAPLMRLDRLICAHRASATLLAKPDYLNPGSSKMTAPRAASSKRRSAMARSARSGRGRAGLRQHAPRARARLRGDGLSGRWWP
ncbi:hypothetical protein [Burkholderia plantarii]|uniref:hypothetical protein n=1 Tax=Burkholderia plantarii TaxID=41899 RepID=UPI001C0C2DB4|nr:hypothetical protein [Burkholderia plantarii]